MRRTHLAAAAALAVATALTAVGPAGAQVPEGSTWNGWKVVYDGNEYTESVTIRGNTIRAKPQPPTGDSTHASLIVSKKKYTNMVLTAKVRTISQLRPTPNPWECAWIVFDARGKHTFNYVAIKPNGWEVGRASEDGQTFLATGETGVPVGQTANVRIVRKGSIARIHINDVKVKVRIPAAWQGGAGGVYTEDADVSATINIRALT